MSDMRACFSFDDGHPADRRLGELLARHGLRATFFVPSANVEGRAVMGVSDIRALAAEGFEIGAHGIDHRRLIAMPPAEMKQQLRGGKRWLEDILGREVPGLCYPGGRHDAGIRQAARDAGYRYGRTTEMLRLDGGTDPFRMPTSLQLYPHGIAALLRNWLRQGQRISQLRLLAGMPSGTLPAMAGYLVRAAQRSGGLLHLWGHSWEFDALQLWPQLDAVFADVAAATQMSHRFSCREVQP